MRAALLLAAATTLAAPRALAGPPGTYVQKRDDPAAHARWQRAKKDAPARDLNAISYKPFSITSRGLTLQYERLLARRFSLLGGLGVRSAAREDYASFTTTFLSEGRYWLTGRDWASGYPGMAGLYLAGAFDAGRTSVTLLRDDRSLGAMWTLQESIRFGNRWVLWDLQELSTALSLDIIHELDEKGRLAPNTRGTLGFDFTVGWVF